MKTLLRLLAATLFMSLSTAHLWAQPSFGGGFNSAGNPSAAVQAANTKAATPITIQPGRDTYNFFNELAAANLLKNLVDGACFKSNYQVGATGGSITNVRTFYGRYGTNLNSGLWTADGYVVKLASDQRILFNWPNYATTTTPFSLMVFGGGPTNTVIGTQNQTLARYSKNASDSVHYLDINRFQSTIFGRADDNGFAMAIPLYEHNQSNAAPALVTDGNIRVLTATCDGTNITWWAEHFICGSTNRANGIWQSGFVMDSLTFGDNPVNIPAGGDETIAGFLFFNKVLGSNDIVVCERAWRNFDAYPEEYVFIGDSRTQPLEAGNTLYQQDFPFQTMQHPFLIGERWINEGQSSLKASDEATNGYLEAKLLPWAPDPTIKTKKVIVPIGPLGFNDWSAGSNAVDVFTAISNMCQKARNWGFTPWVITERNTSFAALSESLNTMIWTNQYLGLYDKVIPYDQIFQPADAANVAYFPDGTHPGVLANTRMASVLANMASQAVRGIATVSLQTALYNANSLLSSNLSTGNYFWTNTLPGNAQVFVNGGTVTGLGLNGSSLYTAAGSYSFILQPNEWLSITSNPVATLKFKPM